LPFHKKVLFFRNINFIIIFNHIHNYVQYQCILSFKTQEMYSYLPKTLHSGGIRLHKLLCRYILRRPVRWPLCTSMAICLFFVLANHSKFPTGVNVMITIFDDFLQLAIFMISFCSFSAAFWVKVTIFSTILSAKNLDKITALVPASGYEDSGRGHY
jgi:hypothetical protein